MEYQNITNLLDNMSGKVPIFITKKLIEVHDQSGETYNTNKQIRFKTLMLRSDLCDYSDAYIVVKGIVTVSAEERDRDEMNRDFALKNNALLISCISKINGVLRENAEDLDFVMSMYNLLEYSKNYSKRSGSLWNYYRDELTDVVNDDNGSSKNVIQSKSFKYETSITRSTYNVRRRITDENGKPADNPNYDQRKTVANEVIIVVPLRNLDNFWNGLNIPLVNCEVSLGLSWSAVCVITSMEKRLLVAGHPNRGDSPTNATFKITDTKLYVPIVTLSAENDNKLLEQLKAGFKRTIKWNKYRSEFSNQARCNIFNCLIDSTFTNVNRLFALSFKNEHGNNDENESVGSSFKKFDVPKVEVKDFNELINQKPFFEIPVKNKEEAYEHMKQLLK